MRKCMIFIKLLFYIALLHKWNGVESQPTSSGRSNSSGSQGSRAQSTTPKSQNQTQSSQSQSQSTASATSRRRTGTTGAQGSQPTKPPSQPASSNGSGSHASPRASTGQSSTPKSQPTTPTSQSQPKSTASRTSSTGVGQARGTPSSATSQPSRGVGVGRGSQPKATAATIGTSTPTTPPTPTTSAAQTKATPTTGARPATQPKVTPASASSTQPKSQANVTPVSGSAAPSVSTSATPTKPVSQSTPTTSVTKVTLNIDTTKESTSELDYSKIGDIHNYTPKQNHLFSKVTHGSVVVWESKTEVHGTRVTYVCIIKYLVVLLSNDMFLLFHQSSGTWTDVTKERYDVDKLKFFGENDAALNKSSYSTTLISYSYSLEFNAGVKCQKVKYGNEDVWKHSDDTDFGSIKSLFIDLISNQLSVKNESGQLKKLEYKPKESNGTTSETADATKEPTTPTTVTTKSDPTTTATATETSSSTLTTESDTATTQTTPVTTPTSSGSSVTQSKRLESSSTSGNIHTFTSGVSHSAVDASQGASVLDSGSSSSTLVLTEYKKLPSIRLTTSTDTDTSSKSQTATPVTTTTTNVALDIDKKQSTDQFEYSDINNYRIYVAKTNFVFNKIVQGTTVIWESKDYCATSVTTKTIDNKVFLAIVLSNGMFTLVEKSSGKWTDITFDRHNVTSLKFYGDRDTEIKSSKYSVTMSGLSYNLDFNTNVDCKKIKYNNVTLWSHTDDSEFGTIKSLSLDLAKNVFFVKNSADIVKKLELKYISLDIDKKQSTDESDYSKSDCHTYMTKSNFVFNRIVQGTDFVWKSQVLFGTKVTAAGDFLTILLNNGTFKLFQKSVGEWIDITPNKHDIGKLKFYGEGDRLLKSYDYSVTLSCLAFSYEFNVGSECHKVKYGDDVLWNHSDDSQFGTIKTFSLDLPKNQFTIKNNSGTVKNVEFKYVILDLNTMESTDHFDRTGDDGIFKFVVKSGYVFSKVVQGTSVVWEPRDSAYCTEVTYIVAGDFKYLSAVLDNGSCLLLYKTSKDKPFKDITSTSYNVTRLKFLTDDNSELSTSDYKVTVAEHCYNLEFNSDVKCSKITHNGADLWKHSDDTQFGTIKSLHLNLINNQLGLKNQSNTLKELQVPLPPTPDVTDTTGTKITIDLNETKEVEGMFTYSHDGKCHTYATAGFGNTFGKVMKGTRVVWEPVGNVQAKKIIYVDDHVKNVVVVLTDGKFLLLKQSDNNWDDVTKYTLDVSKLVFLGDNHGATSLGVSASVTVVDTAMTLTPDDQSKLISGSASSSPVTSPVSQPKSATVTTTPATTPQTQGPAPAKDPEAKSTTTTAPQVSGPAVTPSTATPSPAKVTSPPAATLSGTEVTPPKVAVSGTPVTLDIDNTQSASEYDYKDEGGVVTYTPKENHVFSKVTEGPIVLWKSDDVSGTMVRICSKLLVILFNNNEFKLFEQSEGNWIDITDKRHNLTKLKFFNDSNAQIKPTEYTVTIVELSYRIQFSQGTICRKITLGNDIIYNYQDDTDFGSIGSLDLDLVSNGFFVKNESGDLKSVTKPVILDLETTKSTPEFDISYIEGSDHIYIPKENRVFNKVVRGPTLIWESKDNVCATIVTISSKFLSILFDNNTFKLFQESEKQWTDITSDRHNVASLKFYGDNNVEIKLSDYIVSMSGLSYNFEFKTGVKCKKITLDNVTLWSHTDDTQFGTIKSFSLGLVLNGFFIKNESGTVKPAEPTKVTLDIEKTQSTDQLEYKDQNGVVTYTGKDCHVFSKIMQGSTVVWESEENLFATKVIKDGNKNSLSINLSNGTTKEFQQSDSKWTESQTSSPVTTSSSSAQTATTETATTGTTTTTKTVLDIDIKKSTDQFQYSNSGGFTKFVARPGYGFTKVTKGNSVVFQSTRILFGTIVTYMDSCNYVSAQFINGMFKDFQLSGTKWTESKPIQSNNTPFTSFDYKVTVTNYIYEFQFNEGAECKTVKYGNVQVYRHTDHPFQRSFGSIKSFSVDLVKNRFFIKNQSCSMRELPYEPPLDTKSIDTTQRLLLTRGQSTTDVIEAVDVRPITLDLTTATNNKFSRTDKDGYVTYTANPGFVFGKVTHGANIVWESDSNIFGNLVRIKSESNNMFLVILLDNSTFKLFQFSDGTVFKDITAEKRDVTKLKFLGEGGEINPSDFKVSLADFEFSYEFHDRVKCLRITLGNECVYEHKGGFGAIKSLSLDLVLNKFSTVEVKSVSLDIDKSQSTNEFDHTEKNGVSTFSPKSGHVFTKVTHSNTAIWESDGNVCATIVNTKTSDNKVFLSIFLSNNMFKLFLKSSDGAFKDITNQRHDVKKLKFLGQDDSPLKSTDYSVSMSGHTFLCEFNRGFNCLGVKLGNEDIWKPDGDPKFSTIKSLSLDLIDNKFSLKNESGDIKPVVIPVILDISKTQSTSEFEYLKEYEFHKYTVKSCYLFTKVTEGAKVVWESNDTVGGTLVTTTGEFLAILLNNNLFKLFLKSSEWEDITKSRIDISGLKFLTDDSEIGTSDYKVTISCHSYILEFNPGVECHKITHRGIDLWKSDDDQKFKSVKSLSLCLLSNQLSVTNESGTVKDLKLTSDTTETESTAPVTKYITLDVDKKQSTSEFECKEKNGVTSYTAKSDIVFTKITHKTTVVWESGGNVCAILVSVKAEFLAILLSNNQFKLFQKSSDGTWKDITSQRHNISNLKFLGQGGSVLKSPDYSVSMSGLILVYEFNTKCTKIMLENENIWKPDDDPKFPKIKSLSLDIASNKFSLKSDTAVKELELSLATSTESATKSATATSVTDPTTQTTPESVTGFPTKSSPESTTTTQPNVSTTTQSVTPTPTGTTVTSVTLDINTTNSTQQFECKEKNGVISYVAKSGNVFTKVTHGQTSVWESSGNVSGAMVTTKKDEFIAILLDNKKFLIFQNSDNKWTDVTCDRCDLDELSFFSDDTVLTSSQYKIVLSDLSYNLQFNDGVKCSKITHKGVRVWPVPDGSKTTTDTDDTTKTIDDTTSSKSASDDTGFGFIKSLHLDLVANKFSVKNESDQVKEFEYKPVKSKIITSSSGGTLSVDAVPGLYKLNLGLTQSQYDIVKVGKSFEYHFKPNVKCSMILFNDDTTSYYHPTVWNSPNQDDVFGTKVVVSDDVKYLLLLLNNNMYKMFTHFYNRWVEISRDRRDVSKLKFYGIQEVSDSSSSLTVPESDRQLTPSDYKFSISDFVFSFEFNEGILCRKINLGDMIVYNYDILKTPIKSFNINLRTNQFSVNNRFGDANVELVQRPDTLITIDLNVCETTFEYQYLKTDDDFHTYVPLFGYAFNKIVRGSNDIWESTTDCSLKVVYMDSAKLLAILMDNNKFFLFQESSGTFRDITSMRHDVSNLKFLDTRDSELTSSDLKITIVNNSYRYEFKDGVRCQTVKYSDDVLWRHSDHTKFGTIVSFHLGLVSNKFFVKNQSDQLKMIEYRPGTLPIVTDVNRNTSSELDIDKKGSTDRYDYENNGDDHIFTPKSGCEFSKVVRGEKVIWEASENLFAKDVIFDEANNYVTIELTNGSFRTITLSDTTT
ncbi:hypothetical protein TpMuguga_01g00003 [Theileria parva strain Muguga]|uniref:Hypothetical telomeric SfiI 20 protein 3 n=1 Tax=Theileria parva TaxID=5875 RepID=Q4N9U4_THEPA|nr:uncharacterized protein TpMuguga_01g00003 [Theileria parva strain Muguga]EAN33247.1 hypothetical protein TpMuguga_01g00003 [Theileria parva strain Muguga]|eukprot:XP_765530.1 hypothetical protein [Theileria parva strain Muguga]